MDFYKKLKIKRVRTEPDVWISRIVIYEQIVPEPKIIRDILLNRGLNIVWAEETEEDDPSAEITGHSAGKTTFCRLLRYLLGEKTYGTAANSLLIENAFPNAYVAGELHVKGKKWAVLRPIGKGRYSYVKEEAKVEELIADRSKSAYSETYARILGLEKLLDELAAGDIVRAGEAIQWGHILAWCTRDQEARFQNIYDWRSPRSESEAPVFRSPKAGPLFVMRAVLGLFLPDELKGEEDLSTLKTQSENLDKELERLKKEPQYWINHFDTSLRKLLRKALPDEPQIENLPLHSGNLLPDLARLVTKANDLLQAQLIELEQEQKTLQDKIDDIGAAIKQREQRVETLDGLINQGSTAAGELDKGVSQRESRRELIAEYGESSCLAGKLYKDCPYVKELQNALQITEYQDAKALKIAQAKQVEVIKELKRQKEQAEREIETLKGERKKIQIKRDTRQADYLGNQKIQGDLQQAFNGVTNSYAKRDQAGSDKEMDECRKKIESIDKSIKDLEQKLTQLLTQHNESRELLAKIFSATVKAVLSSGTYDGRVSLDKRELSFTITHGHSMSGEAVETLSVLLTDLTSLVYHTVSQNSHMPGFLLHDSPREADLGLRIYRSYIRFAASLQENFKNQEECPFQYILTTTTAPPKELQKKKYLKLRLNANEPTGLLLGKNIATEQDVHNLQLL